MPNYTFKNINNNEIETHTMRISEYDSFKENNQHLERYHAPGATVAFGDPMRLGVRKPDGGFNEVLSKIASANYKSNLTDSLSRK